MSVHNIDIALAQLQNEVSNCEKAVKKLIQVKKVMYPASLEISKINSQLQQTPIAIIGMASIFPQAKNLQEYWTNIVEKVDCITDIPPSRWNVEDYYNPDPKAPDKTYCKRGGFIPEVDFNPMEFGLPPNILEQTDISQLLGLVVAKEALEDAGYGEFRQFDRELTGVTLGVALARQLNVPLFNRLQYPVWEQVLKSSGLSDEDTQKIVEKIKSAYVQWEENSFPGMLANVIAGRIANRLDLGGMNCVVDAACASSLGALKMAVSELVEHRANMMLTGGVDTDNSIVAYMCFSKTPAVSKSENVKPFDADSDGMMLGEGIGMLVLKRLEDAVRDKDRVYAVIKGIGSSSDGRYKSIYAPRPEGQVRALRRAYGDAGVAPESVSLIEAHGTGTMAGDPTEFSAIKTFFTENSQKNQHIALGSVKSQIGHTKAAAGAASLIKTALALHHKILPPTINVTQPNPKLGIADSPFYLNIETRPWFVTDGDGKRRAGVSSFGFGGTNYHVVLEEYDSDHDHAYRLHQTAQMVLVSAPTPQKLIRQCENILIELQSLTGEQHYTELIEACKSLEIPVTSPRLGFVADSLAEACKLLQVSITWLKTKAESEAWEHPQGVYYRKTGLPPQAKVVALFSGQGSQYLEMGREVVMNFPQLRQIYNHMDKLLHSDGFKAVSEVVFPPPTFDPEKRKAQEAMLQRTEYAQPAIGVFSAGLYQILQQAGFQPDFVAGHSFGELTALWASEVLSDQDYFFLVKSRGQAMAQANDSTVDPGAMLAVKENVDLVKPSLENFPQVSIANFNSNRQVVLAGPTAEIEEVQQTLQEKGFATVLLPVAAAFHTPLIAHAQQAFAQASEAVTFRQAKVPVYTNVTGEPYPTDPLEIRKILETHLIRSVLFKQEIENIYAAGGYCFVEFGPKGILSNLVKDILSDKPHIAVALNGSRQKNSDRSFREAVLKLRIAGLALKNIDPYQIPQKLVAKDNQTKAFSVQLSGVNFVSEKTKQTFEQALQDGHKVKVLSPTMHETNGHHRTQKEKDIKIPTQLTWESNGQQTKLHNGTSLANGKAQPSIVAVTESNGHQMKAQNVQAKTDVDKMTKPVTASATLPSSASYENQAKLQNGTANSTQPTTVSPHSAIQPQMQPTQSNPQNYQRVLESIEYTLSHFKQHHTETLQAHGQYLHSQREYVKTFYHLMQQQNALFTKDKFHQQAGETKQAIAESFERSMMQFHAHQSETLHVHDQYLTHQVEQSKDFFQLIKQEYSHLINGNSVQKSIAATVESVSSSDKQLAPSSQQLKNLSPSPSLYSQEEAVNGKTKAAKPVLVSESVETKVQNPVMQQHESQIETVPRNGLHSVAETVAANTEVAPVIRTKIDLTDFSQTLLTVVSDKTGYPVEMLELDMDMEADLGIDSIKRVEILGALQDLYPDLPKPNPEELAQQRTLRQIVEYLIASVSGSSSTQTESVFSAATSLTNPKPTLTNDLVSETLVTSVANSQPATRIDSTSFAQTLLAVVSDKTGYPVEMLELDMDMEADLGIDSIKRVEILGSVQDIYTDLPKLNPEELTELRTLRQIVEHLHIQPEVAEKKTANISLTTSILV